MQWSLVCFSTAVSSVQEVCFSLGTSQLVLYIHSLFYNLLQIFVFVCVCVIFFYSHTFIPNCGSESVQQWRGERSFLLKCQVGSVVGRDDLSFWPIWPFGV